MAKKKAKKKKKGRKGKKGLWSEKELKLLKKEFPKRPCDEVAKMLGRPFYAVKRKAYRMGIYKTARYLKTLGRSK